MQKIDLKTLYNVLKKYAEQESGLLLKYDDYNFAPYAFEYLKELYICKEKEENSPLIYHIISELIELWPNHYLDIMQSGEKFISSKFGADAFKIKDINKLINMQDLPLKYFYYRFFKYEKFSYGCTIYKPFLCSEILKEILPDLPFDIFDDSQEEQNLLYLELL